MNDYTTSIGNGKPDSNNTSAVTRCILNFSPKIGAQYIIKNKPGTENKPGTKPIKDKGPCVYLGKVAETDGDPYKPVHVLCPVDMLEDGIPKTEAECISKAKEVYGELSKTTFDFKKIMVTGDDKNLRLLRDVRVFSENILQEMAPLFEEVDKNSANSQE